jgi:hypothetical protein
VREVGRCRWHAREEGRATLGGFQDRGGLTMRRTDAVVIPSKDRRKKFGQMMQLLFTHSCSSDPGLLRALSTLR